VPLKIVGTGPLESAVEVAAGSCPAIQWLGKQPLEEVYRLIGDAKFLVLPSQCYENFPRVVTEAYAKGTPVIASRLGAMAEVVDHGRTGMHFAPGDADDLAARVRELVRLADNQAMRLAARAEYEALYTGECNYRTLMSIYERAMQGGSQ
jgi:glycosyltransferase involved in cell wall biosynthesis